MKIEQLNNGETLKGNLLQPAQTKSLHTIRHKDNNELASQSSARQAPLRDESIIVASAMSDDEDMDEDRLQKTFEMINATADRILDQIDKVASFSSEDYFPDDYDEHSQMNGSNADDQTKTNYRLSTGMSMFIHVIMRRNLNPIRFIIFRLSIYTGWLRHMYPLFAKSSRKGCATNSSNLIPSSY